MKRYTHLIAAGLLLGALSPLETHAQNINTWRNTSGSSQWGSAGANWTSPTVWNNGDTAVFDATAVGGPGIVTLTNPIVANSIYFNADGYTLQDDESYSGILNTLTTTNITTSVASATASIQASLAGTTGITFNGPGTNILQGDTIYSIGNTYTGGSTITSGTLVLRAGATANGGAGSYAVDSISALYSGATVQLGTVVVGLNTVSAIGGQLPTSQSSFPCLLNLIGGTFDLNGDNGKNNLPVPSGSGLIVNNCSVQGANLTMQWTINGGNVTNEFDGSIADGGDSSYGYTNQANGNFPYRVNVDLHYVGNNTVLLLGGSNSYSGSTRVGSGTIKLVNGGTLGSPGYVPGVTGPSRIYGNIDLGGTPLVKIGGFKGINVNSGMGTIYNSAPCTLSIFSFGWGNVGANSVTVSPAYTYSGGEGVNQNSFADNLGTGGRLGLMKVGSNTINFNPAASTTTSATGNQNTYSGPTTVVGGVMGFESTAAVSPNTVIFLSGGSISLDYTGTQNVQGLVISGVPQPAGVYGPGSSPNILSTTSAGYINVLNGPATVWNNGSANSQWDLCSANWSGPSLWEDGLNATFGSTGVGTVSLNNNITAGNLTFNADGYEINGNGNALTLINGATITRAANTTNLLAVDIGGTNGLTYAGSGTSVIQGDPSLPLATAANWYKGGTIIHGGTVILSNTAAFGTGSSSPYALDGVAALDAGATLVIPGVWNGGSYGADRDQIAVHGQIPGFPQSYLHMTGGTLDLWNDAKNQNIPVPDGTGTIINSGSWSQAGCQFICDGQDHSFYGVIADGNNGVLNGDNTGADNAGQGPGYQIGIVQVAGGVSLNGINGGAAGPYQHWYWYGSNTYSGSTRLDNGVYLKLMGNGTIGSPTATGALTGPMRLYNAVLDLNGHNQTISLMTHGGVGAIIQNTAPGTVSTLTIGYGMEQVFNRYAQYTFQDSWGGGGILALKKINTAPYLFPVVAQPGQYLATNCVQDLRGVCTYSGDTTLLGGGLILSAQSAVSSNSAYRIYTPNNYTLLTLNYVNIGPAYVRQLWINGVQQPNGTYGSIGNSLGAIGVAGIDPASTGTITVTGYAPVVLNTTQSGGNLNFSWAGVYKLQSKTNLVGGTWTDVAGGGTSPVSIPVNKTLKSMFYRLSTY